nr:glycoprotein 3-alpha-L-fucosyltransferase A-like [Penaeus vannamei]
MSAFVTLVWFLKRFEASMNLQPRNGSAPISLGSLGNRAYPRLAVPDGPLKKILLWNDFYGKLDYGFGTGRGPFQAAGCRVDACVVIIDRNLFPLEELDALVWHTRSRDVSMPARSGEFSPYPLIPATLTLPHPSPSPTSYLSNHSSYFLIYSHLIISYLSNHSSYFQESSHPLIRKFAIREVYESKNAIFRIRESESETRTRDFEYKKREEKSCGILSLREDYGFESLEPAKSLQKWLTVDVYGNCGPYRCAQTNWRECHALLNSTYKFYLSFENSLCRDYVTEKFFTTLQLDIVPVVYGYANYSRLAPAHSYIDALSFNTTKALAEYLLYLDKNDTAYNEYFGMEPLHNLPQPISSPQMESLLPQSTYHNPSPLHRWKRYYHQLSQHDLKAQAFCDLCERLHFDKEPKNHDINSWFDEGTQCLSLEEPRIKQLTSE